MGLTLPRVLVVLTERRYAPAPAELRTRICPTCGERSRPTVFVSMETGAWFCHPHSCHGDIFDLADWPALKAHSLQCEALPVFQAHRQAFHVTPPKTA